jgi:hypothetical protein
MPSDPDRSSDACSELLLLYQGAVVHDLRGDLNGLLLTLDFIRRQLGSRPDMAAAVGESLGDLDGVRSSLTRTLNQLDAVGHARRVVIGRDKHSPAEQNLRQVVNDVVQLLADRGRRRGLTLTVAGADHVTVNLDQVLLRLTVHRLLAGLVDSTRNTEVTVSVNTDQGRVALTAAVGDPKQLPEDLLDRAERLDSTTHPVPQALLAISLTMRVSRQLGGSLRRVEGPGGVPALVLDLPAREAAIPAA